MAVVGDAGDVGGLPGGNGEGAHFSEEFALL